MTPFPDDKKNKKKDEISKLQNELLEDSKILKEKFNSIETENEKKESPETTKIQENLEKFVGNTQNVINKWESDWKVLNQKNIEKRKERRRKIILGERINNGLVNTFFSNQKKAFNKKLKELEEGISNDQPLTPKEIREFRRLKRWEKRQELKDQRKQMIKKHRLKNLELSEETQANRRDFLEQKKNNQKNYSKEQKENRQFIAKEKREHKSDFSQKRKESFKEITTEKKQMRKENWNRYIRMQRRKTQRFMKFQNRLWWKGYLTFLLEVILIVAFLAFLLWIFQLIGVDLIELTQNLF